MRLIDADALKKLRDDYIRGRVQFEGDEYDLVDKCPTIDAVLVVHGRWGRKDHYQNGYYLYTSCECSVCGGCPPVEYRFCPDCGARMDGDGNG